MRRWDRDGIDGLNPADGVQIAVIIKPLRCGAVESKAATSRR